MWPILMTGLLLFFVYEGIRGSEKIASIFGRFGRGVYERTNIPSRALKRIEHIEEMLERTSDKLECATTYLMIDAEWHQETNVIIAENCARVVGLLPQRIPFTEFSRRWDDGWRPGEGLRLLEG